MFGFSWYQNNNAEKARIEQETQRREQYLADSLDRAMNPEKYAEQERETALRDSLEAVIRQEHAESGQSGIQKTDSIQAAALAGNIGEALFAARTGEEEIYTLENQVMKMRISSHGAQIVNVELKDYKRFNGEPLMMFAEGSNKFNLSFFIRRTHNFAQVNTQDYFFESPQPTEIYVEEGEESKSVRFRLAVDSLAGAYLEYVYTMRPDDYMVDFDVNFSGMEQITSTMTDFIIDWENNSVQNERSFRNENQATTIVYRYPDARGIEQLGASEYTKEASVKTKMRWLGFKQQYFSSFLVAEDNFISSELKFDTFVPGYDLIKHFTSSSTVQFNNRQQTYEFKYYFGPNQYTLLKSHGEKFEKVLPLGGSLISWINTGFVIKMFGWLSQHISSIGIIILIMTVMIKLIILPLTFSSYKSSAKMRVLKPEIDEIGSRYPDKADAMKKQQEVMALYKKTGVKPLGGCLPMLIQMPILIAMFRFFPASIELRGQSFLWAEDLSTYDAVIDLGFNIPFYGSHVSLFALLMAVAMYFYSAINFKLTASAGPQMAGMKFMSLYLMPVLMLLWFNSYASGLTYYYLLSNLFTIGQMMIFRYAINEEKLHAKLKSNAAQADSKPKKNRSKWQEKYAAAMRMQQEALRKQQEEQGAKSGLPKTKSRQQATNRQPAKKRK